MMQVSVRRLVLAALGSFMFVHPVCAETATVAVPAASAPPSISISGTAPAPGTPVNCPGNGQNSTVPCTNPMSGPGPQPGQSTLTLTTTTPATPVPATTTPASTGPATTAPGIATPATTTSVTVAAPAAVAPPTADTSLSAIEKALIEDSAGTDKGKPQQFQTNLLRQFGYSFFRPGSDSFAAQTDIPVGPDYTIGPGDNIILSSWGTLEGTFALEVNRSGEIQLPKVGPLKVWGASFERLPTLIRNALARVYRDFEINVTMGKLRVIKVYIVGEVNNPGDYNVSSLSTVINALSAAGGPLKGGSLRNITIRRSGKVIDTIDLYDFFLKGDKSRDIRLQSGDTVFVPIIGPTVGVTGSVKRPAIYELKGESTLKDLLELSGDLLPTGYLQRVQISRVTAHDRKTVNDFNLDPKGGKLGPEAMASLIPVRDLDLVKVFPISGLMRDQVRLEGYVLRPGDYALKPDMRISDLLPPDNILPEYYREAGELIRLVAPDLHPEIIIFNPAKAIAGDQTYDLKLQEFDTVRIFSRWDKEEMPKVRINGEVQKPGEYRFFPNMNVRDLLVMAGNPKLTAYMKSAEISRIRQTGEAVISYPITIDLSKILIGDKDSNIPLVPFDELTIRKIPNWTEETDRYVTLKGEFVFPGSYPIYKGEKLSSVIARAGGFTPKAYFPGAKFTRVSVQRDQQTRMDEALARADQDIFRMQSEKAAVATTKEELDATNAALEGLMRGIVKLKAARAEGRVLIRLRPLDEFRDSKQDVELLGGDALEVPPRPNSINLFGSIYNQTSLVYEEGLDVSDYLHKVGGTTRDADINYAYLIRADGTVLSYQNAPGFLFYNSFFSTALSPGDSIVIPQIIERTAWMRNIKDITTILSQLAITAGTVLLGLR